METIAKTLKRLREAKGLSQLELAKAVGVSPSTYRDWEYGKQIKGEPYLALANALNVSVYELLTGQTEVHSLLRKELDALIAVAERFRKLAQSLGSECPSGLFPQKKNFSIYK